MILLLDTSTPECKLWLYENGALIKNHAWQADRMLAEGIFEYVSTQLKTVDKTWDDLMGVGVFKGPGSFTGLRISATVLNAIAADRTIPIIGATGEDWIAEILRRIDAGEDDKIVLPEYGRAARITAQRK